MRFSSGRREDGTRVFIDSSADKERSSFHLSFIRLLYVIIHEHYTLINNSRSPSQTHLKRRLTEISKYNTG
ncbi:hypothetical protein C0J52_16969 [Blattella germanica]|nr:hypothetical protein C0J52_16969 [Blattella germanica]